jgi:hypothetical protein
VETQGIHQTERREAILHHKPWSCFQSCAETSAPGQHPLELILQFSPAVKPTNRFLKCLLPLHLIYENQNLPKQQLVLAAKAGIHFTFEKCL